jgi:hypothetical protein
MLLPKEIKGNFGIKNNRTTALIRNSKSFSFSLNYRKERREEFAIFNNVNYFAHQCIQIYILFQSA